MAATPPMALRGAIYEREFGDRTAEEVQRLTAFDPGPGWTRLKDEEQ